MRTVGVLLIVTGLLVLLVGGVRFTGRQEVARVGSATVTIPAPNYGALPNLVGAALLLAGAGLLGASARRRRRA